MNVKIRWVGSIWLLLTAQVALGAASQWMGGPFDGRLATLPVIVAVAALLPLLGWLAARLGRRAVPVGVTLAWTGTAGVAWVAQDLWALQVSGAAAAKPWMMAALSGVMLTQLSVTAQGAALRWPVAGGALFGLGWSVMLGAQLLMPALTVLDGSSPASALALLAAGLTLLGALAGLSSARRLPPEEYATPRPVGPLVWQVTAALLPAALIGWVLMSLGAQLLAGLAGDANMAVGYLLAGLVAFGLSVTLSGQRSGLGGASALLGGGALLSGAALLGLVVDGQARPGVWSAALLGVTVAGVLGARLNVSAQALRVALETRGIKGVPRGMLIGWVLALEALAGLLVWFLPLPVTLGAPLMGLGVISLLVGVWLNWNAHRS